MFFAKEAPDDCHIFYDDVDGYCGEGPTDTQTKPKHTETVKTERLYHPKYIHVYIYGPNETANQVDYHRHRYGAECCQYHV